MRSKSSFSSSSAVVELQVSQLQQTNSSTDGGRFLDRCLEAGSSTAACRFFSRWKKVPQQQGSSPGSRKILQTSQAGSVVGGCRILTRQQPDSSTLAGGFFSRQYPNLKSRVDPFFTRRHLLSCLQFYLFSLRHRVNTQLLRVANIKSE